MRIGISALAMRGSAERLDSGIAHYCHALVDAMIAERSPHELVLWLSSDFACPPAWQTAPGVEIHRATLSGYKTLWEWARGAGAARQTGCDVWFSTAHALPWGLQVPGVLSVQDLFTFTHPEFYTRKHRWVIGHALRRAVLGADGIVAISQHTADEVVRLFPVPADRVKVTRLGFRERLRVLSPDAVAPGDLRDIGVGDGPFLLTLSTVEPRKNLPRLMMAFANLTERPEYRDLRLVVAGRMGWKTEESLGRPAELGIEDRVDFVGYVPDEGLARLFAACEGFVLPSLIEGFGLPLLEALASGVPTASSNAGSLPEVGGELPHYFDPMDVEAMGVALEAVLRQARSRPRDVAVGTAHAGRFRWSDTARATLEVIERVGSAGSR